MASINFLLASTFVMTYKTSFGLHSNKLPDFEVTFCVGEPGHDIKVTTKKSKANHPECRVTSHHVRRDLGRMPEKEISFVVSQFLQFSFCLILSSFLNCSPPCHTLKVFWSANLTFGSLMQGILLQKPVLPLPLKVTLPRIKHP